MTHGPGSLGLGQVAQGSVEVAHVRGGGVSWLVQVAYGLGVEFGQVAHGPGRQVQGRLPPPARTE